MASKSHRIFICCGILLLLSVCIQKSEQMTISPPTSTDTTTAEVEKSCEACNENDEHEQRKRAADNSDNADAIRPHAAIPGLPDPATIIKVAELFQSVSEQLVPIIVEGISTPAELITKQINKNFQMLSKFKNRLELLSDEWKGK